MKNCYAKCIVFLLFETGTDIDHATVLTIRLCNDTVHAFLTLSLVSYHGSGHTVAGGDLNPCGCHNPEGSPGAMVQKVVSGSENDDT
jgi:hypothetical protein